MQRTLNRYSRFFKWLQQHCGRCAETVLLLCYSASSFGKRKAEEVQFQLVGLIKSTGCWPQDQSRLAGDVGKDCCEGTLQLCADWRGLIRWTHGCIRMLQVPSPVLPVCSNSPSLALSQACKTPTNHSATSRLMPHRTRHCRRLCPAHQVLPGCCCWCIGFNSVVFSRRYMIMMGGPFIPAQGTAAMATAVVAPLTFICHVSVSHLLTCCAHAVPADSVSML